MEMDWGSRKEVIGANPGDWIERDGGSRMYQAEG